MHKLMSLIPMNISLIKLFETLSLPIALKPNYY